MSQDRGNCLAGEHIGDDAVDQISMVTGLSKAVSFVHRSEECFRKISLPMINHHPSRVFRRRCGWSSPANIPISVFLLSTVRLTLLAVFLVSPGSLIRAFQHGFEHRGTGVGRATGRGRTMRIAVRVPVSKQEALPSRMIRGIAIPCHCLAAPICHQPRKLSISWATSAGLSSSARCPAPATIFTVVGPAMPFAKTLA